MPEEMFKELLSLARQTAEHHEADKHISDPDRQEYVEVKLLKEVERLETLMGIWTATCQFERCKKAVETMAYDREKRVLGFYCGDHAYQVADKGDPEYRESCPNCGCYFGVN